MLRLRFCLVLIAALCAFITASNEIPPSSTDSHGSTDDFWSGSDDEDSFSLGEDDEDSPPWGGGYGDNSFGADDASTSISETLATSYNTYGVDPFLGPSIDLTQTSSNAWDSSSTATSYPDPASLDSEEVDPSTGAPSSYGLDGSSAIRFSDQEPTTTDLPVTFPMSIIAPGATATSNSHQFSTTSFQETASSTVHRISSSSPTSDSQNDRSGLNHRNRTIVIAVSTVAGTIALGILLGLLFCWLRHRHRNQADESTSAMPLARNGEGEMETAGDLGFSHWNGRKVERYTPLTTNNDSPLVESSSLGPRMSGNHYPQPFPTNPNLANPFVPQPPPARKPVGSPPSSKKNTRAAGIEEIAGAVASRHNEENSSQRPINRQDYIGSSESHSSATYQVEREPLTNSTTNVGDTNDQNMSDGTPTAMTNASISQRSKPLPPVGLARFIGSSRKKEPHSALSPPTTAHSRPDGRHASFNNNSESIKNQQYIPLPAGSTSDSNMLVSMPSEEQRRSLGERQMAHEQKRASTPRQSLLMHQPRVVKTSSKHLSLIEASAQASRRSKIHGSREVVTSSRTLDGEHSSISPKGPGMSNGAVRPMSDVQSLVSRQERTSFSYPRAQPYAGPELHMNTQEGQNRSNEEGLETALSTIISAPSIPWQEAPRSSSESRRSFGPDGRPRRLRQSDFEDRGGGSNRRPGIGRAL